MYPQKFCIKSSLIETLRQRIEYDGTILVLVSFNHDLIPERIKEGNQLQLSEELIVILNTIRYKNKKLYTIFTSKQNLTKGPQTNIITVKIKDILEKALANDQIFGVAINPWTENIVLTKGLIDTILVK